MSLHLLSLGAKRSKIEDLVENAWMNLTEEEQGRVVNPFDSRTAYDKENPHIWLLNVIRNPDYFQFTAKYIFNIDLELFQLCILRELWKKNFIIFIGSRGLSKSFLLGLYALFRATFTQGSKTVICSAGFRQARLVFEYAENIWRQAPVFQDLIGSSNKRFQPRHDVDRNFWRIGVSQISAIPLGDGQKVRGQRASSLIIEETASVNSFIYENVLSGFAAVSLDPVKESKKRAKVKKLKELGLWDDEQETLDILGQRSNQQILSGTAYYSWNWVYKYLCLYSDIIKSGGDKERLRGTLEGKFDDNSLNWKDFSVIRVPADLLPDGFMDQKNLARSKAMLHSSLYAMEFGACKNGDTKILTDYGFKKIMDIKVGDKVLTHEGRFKPVAKVMRRKHTGKIYRIRSYGSYEEFFVTPEHPFYQEGEWAPISEVGVGDSFYLSNLVELSGLDKISTIDYTDRYHLRDGYVYPKSSQSILTDEQYQLAKTGSGTMVSIAKELGVSFSAIWVIRNKQRPRPKNAITEFIKLDYDFGLIVGYYAAEGSVGSDGRAISFSLDGHVNTKLEVFIKELSDAIKKVFGFCPKYYKSEEDNVCHVNINSRIIGDIFSKICPGVAHTKYVLPHILFSNEEFLRGFLRGYWSGDGHVSDERNFISCSSASLSLIGQVKLALTYFGFSSSLGYTPPGIITIRGKHHQTKEAYPIRVGAEHAVSFKKLILGKDTSSNPSKCIKNDGRFGRYVIREKELVDWDDYVYNLEVEDDNSYSTSVATVHNCFISDSDGFFKRSLIESCVVGKKDNPIVLPSCGEVNFTAQLVGSQGRQYIYGIDPAAERDNFAIIVIEKWPDHRRIVYSWTITRQRHKERIKKGLVEAGDFYGYCAQKIRSLMKIFPPICIAVDTEGGGRVIEEALGATKGLASGEHPIYRIKTNDGSQPTDSLPGLHLLQMINFSISDWVSQANHGMRKDFEDKILLFPYFDSISLSLAIEDDKAAGRSETDSYEDCVFEIEELKDELATIVHTQVGVTGRDRWDVPSDKTSMGIQKKGVLRKDRYSALLMANMAARQMDNKLPEQEYSEFGAIANMSRSKDKPTGRLYTGIDDEPRGLGMIIKRR